MYRIQWDFSHFDEALQSGKLSAEDDADTARVYCFGCTEPQMVPFNDTTTVVPIPVIVAVRTEVPLPEKLGLNSVQMQQEQIVDMQRFKMGWMPLVLPKLAAPRRAAGAAGAISKRRRGAAARVWGLSCTQASRRTASVRRACCVQRAAGSVQISDIIDIEMNEETESDTGIRCGKALLLGM